LKTIALRVFKERSVSTEKGGAGKMSFSFHMVKKKTQVGEEKFNGA